MNRNFLIIVFLLLGIIGFFMFKAQKEGEVVVAFEKKKVVANNMMNQAFKASFDATLFSIRSGLAARMAMQSDYPESLDDQNDGPCEYCFADVTPMPMNNPKWVKEGNVYTLNDTFVLEYDPEDGTVDQVEFEEENEDENDVETETEDEAEE